MASFRRSSGRTVLSVSWIVNYAALAEVDRRFTRRAHDIFFSRTAFGVLETFDEFCILILEF